MKRDSSRQSLLFLGLVICLLIPFARAAEIPPDAAPAEKPLIQVALLLDTSSSMQGLLNQAKTQLWTIVNEFALARQDGVRPDFKVALYEYGNKTLPAAKGYVRQVSPLTDDLDKISEQLSALKIMSYGSNEYAGWAIQSAAKELAWSKRHTDLKLIFIAGNESFSQGPVAYASSCKAAITGGIMVNTIFCGSYAEGARLGWKDGALRGEGMYNAIDQNQVVTSQTTRQDKEIVRLSAGLNKTYIPFGAKGDVGKKRQEAQDRGAESKRDSQVERAILKGTDLYRNNSWDLVDAVREKKVNLETIDEAQLPEVMRKMTTEQRRAHVQTKADERRRIQKRIAALADARNEAIAKEKATMSGATVETGRATAKPEEPSGRPAAEVNEDEADLAQVKGRSRAQPGQKKPEASAAKASRAPQKETLDSAMIRMLRKQAAAKKFKLKPEKVKAPPKKETK